MKHPPFKNNEGFYDIPLSQDHKGDYYDGLENRKTERIYRTDPTGREKKNSITYEIYDKKYNVYFVYSKTKKVFDVKFKTTCHKLNIGYSINLREIKSLPQELLSLTVQGSHKFLRFPLEILPKNLVSLTFIWSSFPFNTGDLSFLKKLKVLRCATRSLIILPKLPKSIMYIDCMGSSLMKSSLEEIDLKKYPNLKWIGLPSHCKPLPEHLKKAKKEGKIKIQWW